MEPVRQVESLLQRTFQQLPGRSGSEGSLRIDPPLGTEEAANFLEGLQTGLFTVGEDGFVSSRLLPPPRAPSEPQKTLQLFWSQSKSPFLFREGVCQVSAACALVLRYGWPIACVRLEPYKEDVGDFAYGADLVVKTRDQECVIVGEVKRRESDLRRLMRDFRSCAALGPHEKGVCPRRANHPKFEICWALRPTFFWAVCPGSLNAFRVTYTSTVELEPIDDLPSANAVF